MIIVNGKINDNVEIDAGINFGVGVFETMLVRDSALFLEEHCSRIQKAITALGINNGIDEMYLLRMIKEYSIKNCVLKVLVTDKNIVISTRENTYKPNDYKKGFRLKISDMKRNPYSHTIYYKTINYTDNIIEKRLASNEGYQEVLFLNNNDEIAEGSVSNIFFVKDKKIYTPKIECGILNGIIRDWVICNYDVEEGRYGVEDMRLADEVFITNSVMGIMKVKSIQGVSEYNQYEVYDRIKTCYEDVIKEK